MKILSILIIGLALTGCMSMPAEYTNIPEYNNAIEESVQEWIGQDYHKVKSTGLPISSYIRAGSGKIEYMGNGRKRIQFTDISHDFYGLTYIVFTNSEGII